MYCGVGVGVAFLTGVFVGATGARVVVGVVQEAVVVGIGVFIALQVIFPVVESHSLASFSPGITGAHAQTFFDCDASHIHFNFLLPSGLVLQLLPL
jgi:hypothetical protein